MDMSKEQLNAWQSYFMEKQYKQPFFQLWEPCYEREEILSDRYRDCSIRSVYLLKRKEMGIDVQWYDQAFYDGEIWEHRHLEMDGFKIQAYGTEEKLEQNIKNQVLFFVINYTILPMSAILRIYAEQGIVDNGSNFRIGEGTKIKLDKKGQPIIEEIIDKKTGEKIKQAAQHKTYHFSSGLPQPPILDQLIPYIETKKKKLYDERWIQTFICLQRI